MAGNNYRDYSLGREVNFQKVTESLNSDRKLLEYVDLCDGKQYYHLFNPDATIILDTRTKKAGDRDLSIICSGRNASMAKRTLEKLIGKKLIGINN